MRKDLWNNTNELIMEHNATDSSFKLGHNKFSDYTDYERTQILGKNKSHHVGNQKVILKETNATSVDWRDHGAVTPVKDQG